MSVCHTGKMLMFRWHAGVAELADAPESKSKVRPPRDTFAPLEQLRIKNICDRGMGRYFVTKVYSHWKQNSYLARRIIYEATHKIRTSDLLCCDLSAAEFEGCYRSSTSGGRRAKIQSAERNDSSRRHGTMELGRERPQLNLWHPWESERIMGFRRAE